MRTFGFKASKINAAWNQKLQNVERIIGIGTEKSLSGSHIHMKMKQDRQDVDDGNGFMIFGSSKNDNLHWKVF